VLGLVHRHGLPRRHPAAVRLRELCPTDGRLQLRPAHPDLLGPRWAEVWRQRLDCSAPWGNVYLEHLLDGPFWETRLLRGQEERVRAATFLIGGWCDWYPDDFLRVFARLRCPKRILIGPWTHNYPENAWPLPRINDRFECLRWFDKHLKGIDTDPARPLEREPPVTLFVQEFTRPAALRRQDNGAFRHETQWPPACSKPRSLFLSATGQLLAEEAGAAVPAVKNELTYRPDVGIASGRWVIGQMLPGWGMPDDQRLDEGFSLVYTADAAEAELVGVPEAQLFISCTAEVAFLALKLCEVAPDGTSVLITKGVLNLTHRTSHLRPEPLVPGQVYEVRVPFLACAWRVRPGHRLRLMIAAADLQNAWPSPLPHTLTVHVGPEHPSRLCLPFAGPEEPPLPEPHFLASDFPPLPPDQVPTPSYGVHRDLVGQTATVSYTTQSGIGINRSSFTVNVRRPAEAAVKSEFEYPLDRPGLSIRVCSQCTTRSDEQAFHHLTQVEITVNGRPYWSKSWAVSVPRPLC
jgi:predicted acyl esterase